MECMIAVQKKRNLCKHELRKRVYMAENQKNGKLEKLEEEIRFLLPRSKDRYFTEYLQKLLQRLIQQRYQVDLMQDELDRMRAEYLQRLRLSGIRDEEVEKMCVLPAGDTNTAQPQASDTIQLQASDAMQTQASDTVQPQVRYTSANVWNPPTPQPPKKHTGEFVIGAVLLSIFGGAFILAALVMLGVNYMNGFVMGMSLYGAGGIVVLVSEVFVYRKWKRLGSTLSAIGIGGLYLATVINYLALHNLPLWVAMLITLGIMLFVIFLSRKRESAMYRIFGLIACYLCFMPINEGITNGMFLAVIGMIFLVNVMCLLLPVKEHGVGVSIVHMLANTIFAQIFIWRAHWCNVAEVPCMVFLISSLAIVQFLFVLQIKRQKKNDMAGIQAVYCISSALYLFMLYAEAIRYGTMKFSLWAVVLGSLFGICLAAFLILRKSKEKWYIFTFFNMAALMIAQFFTVPVSLVFYFALLLLVKIASVKKEELLLKLNDGVLTAFICVQALFWAKEAGSGSEMLYMGLMFFGVLLCIPFIRYWQTYFALLITYTIAGVTAYTVLPMLRLPVFTGVLFGGLLLFNGVNRLRGKYMSLFNGFVLSGQIICFLMLAWPVYRNAYITYLFMLVFGLATIVLGFQEKYHMNFSFKGMITAVFLTYMAFIVKTQLPVINSILMMLVALISVAAGFVEKKKNIRIYGLVLSILVCGKIVLYDFMSVPTLQKMLLFFAVGVIALLIAGIYIVLEKKNGAEETD